MLGHTHIPPFIPRENMRHVVSVSDGKDSGATYLHALELLDGDFLAVCADTGNEHPETLEYVARLHERTGGPKVQIIKADFTVNPSVLLSAAEAASPAHGTTSSD